MALYTINNVGTIVGLDIEGPLRQPTEISIDDVITMLRKGYEIYQHNPCDLTEKKKVTLENVTSIKFKGTLAAATLRRIQNRKNQQMESTLRQVKPNVGNIHNNSNNYNDNKRNNNFYDKKKDKHNNQRQNDSTPVVENKEETSDVKRPDGFETI